LLPPNNFLLETITLASYQNDIQIKVDQIEYTTFYKNESSTDSATTNEKFLLYLVNNSNGIYEGITKVLLNALTDQRILYFVGKKMMYIKHFIKIKFIFNFFLNINFTLYFI
jgi:hypothetical protein